jgi:signal transduction histidine kinase
MNKIVSDLLDYARPIHPEIMETNMHQLIHDTLLSLEIPETIKVSEVVPKRMKLEVDTVLMRRVFINLITNSIQAMPDGGKLEIKASKKAEDVFISVKDTGVGIRKEDLSKLFQPLFTTKSKGQGFGLPVCKRIVDAHGGVITVKSKVGEGTTVTVIIPQQATGK